MKLEPLPHSFNPSLTLKGRASPTPGLAITRLYRGSRPLHMGYRVTHLVSGRIATVEGEREQYTYAQAKAIAILLAPIADWTQSLDQLDKTTVVPAVRRVIRFITDQASLDTQDSAG